MSRSLVAFLAAVTVITNVSGCSDARSQRELLMARNHLKQIGLGLMSHEIMKKELPAHASYDADGKPLLSWRVHILPYLEVTDQPGLYEEFHLDEPWDSQHNKQLIERMPAVYRSAGFRLDPGKTCFLAVVGDGCAIDGTPQGKTVGMVQADSPKQIVLIEAPENESVVWTKPDDFELAVDLPSARTSHQSDGWNVLWADGNVSLANADELATFTKPAGGAKKPAE